MDRRPLRIAALLFGSGACALIYQVAWLRELRLVFGASTAASGAVLAIFLGGLGVGGVVLGRRADAEKNPLDLYARLELAVAATSAVTPLLVWIVRKAYAGLGGTSSLGMTGGTIVRLLLSALVLAGPTVLMGGTLPAAARAAEDDRDASRRRLAVLYGLNTLGAVTGAFVSTFVLLEVFGARMTLWMACLVNALIGLLARVMARETSGETAKTDDAKTDEPSPEAIAAPDAKPEPTAEDVLPSRLVLAAAAIVGFAFLLMELVWYRMLAPLLGGTSYTFGLILAVALLGIGLGGAAYAVLAGDRPATPRGFATTSALEALAIAVPFALGDRLAFLAIALRTWGSFGFWGHVGAWTVLTSIVVFPAAFLSGVQFPQLIALLGRGRKDVGKQLGLAYAWNTGGSIAGSLLGGFGVLPLLTAPGTWRAVVFVLAALAGATLWVASQKASAEERQKLVVPGLVGALAVILVLRALGPTAAWRHQPIGAGRADAVMVGGTRNSLREIEHRVRRTVAWEADGREASVALVDADSDAFLVNGKSDGDARWDAGTQVLLGLVGAYLHGAPKQALVVGLGTGSTAGWLGAAPTIEDVDVLEIEPAIVHVAQACAAVNHDALANPKVHVIEGDGREALLTTKKRYDLIVSEPSNPYRAGVSSLFTQDFYRAAADRLNAGGYFIQWVQAYEIDASALGSVYATIGSVFSSVTTFQTKSDDFLVLASNQPLELQAGELRARLREEPYRSAFLHAWRTTSLEGVLAHHVARASLARAIADAEGSSSISTDDRNVLEFAMARTVGRSKLLRVDDVRGLARARGEEDPVVRGEVDWPMVADWRAVMDFAEDQAPGGAEGLPRDLALRVEAMTRSARQDLPGALKAWRQQPRKPQSLLEMEMLAELVADAGEAEEAEHYIGKLKAYEPTAAMAILAVLRFREGKLEEASSALEQAFLAYRTDPWPRGSTMFRALDLTLEIARRNRPLGARLFELLKEPFAAGLLNERRLQARRGLAILVDFKGKCVEATSAFEPWVPWERDFLAARLECYDVALDPRAAKAKRDLDELLDGEGASLGAGLAPPQTPPQQAFPLPPRPSASAPVAASASASPAPSASAPPSSSASATPSAAPPATSASASPKK